MKMTLDLPRQAEGLSEEEIEKLFLIGWREMKTEKALLVLRKGGVSIWKAAEMAGLSLREMIEEARRRGVEARVTDEMLKEIEQ